MVDKTNFNAKAEDLVSQADKKLKGRYDEQSNSIYRWVL